MGKLTALSVKSSKAAGRYPDGDGLYLQVAPGGSRQWLFRFKLDGRERLMGLGPAGDPPGKVPLADARRGAADARGLVRDGLDPIEARLANKKAQEAERRRAELHSFEMAAEAYVAAREHEWRNDKHRAQWRATLATYAYPKIGSMPVSAVGTAAVLQVLEPIWREKPETASRLRGRIESILDYARSLDLRTGENPARWRGHLAYSLPKPGKLRRIRHHPALPWERMAEFMVALRSEDGMAARALEFVVLTAARSGEVLGACWREVDLVSGVWTVPFERTKASREHRVPLSAPALDLLQRIRPLARDLSSPVFPGRLASAPLSGMALEMLIRRMNTRRPLPPAAEGTSKSSNDDERPRWADRNEHPITPHGFRSTFRDWVGESTDYSTDLAEAALAHVIRDKTVAAYARGDLFDKRRRLMADWARHSLHGSAEP